MPRATADTTKTERHELKTLPEAYVVLKKLTYGQMLHRQEMAGEMAMKSQPGRGRNTPQEAVIKMMQSLVTEYEFRNCIVDHNLTDENDQPLNFSLPGTVMRLDPQVGDEISQLIDDLNQYQDDNPLGNSNTGSDAT